MALIIYPTTDWDSYVSLDDANSLILSNTTDSADWDAITDDTTKEIYLRQSTLLIKLDIEDPNLSETPINLKLATSLLANYSVGKDMLDSDDSKTNLKVLDIDSAVKKEWFAPAKATNSFPDVVVKLLEEFSFSSSSSFVFERA